MTNFLRAKWRFLDWPLFWFIYFMVCPAFAPIIKIDPNNNSLYIKRMRRGMPGFRKTQSFERLYLKYHCHHQEHLLQNTFIYLVRKILAKQDMPIEYFGLTNNLFITMPCERYKAWSSHFINVKAGTWVHVLALPFNSCVPLGNLPNFSESHFPHLLKGITWLPHQVAVRIQWMYVTDSYSIQFSSPFSRVYKKIGQSWSRTQV